jgi:hypothetical protein
VIDACIISTIAETRIVRKFVRDQLQHVPDVSSFTVNYNAFEFQFTQLAILQYKSPVQK